jgi:N-acetyl-gamma-glutamylphosphate reductase
VASWRCRRSARTRMWRTGGADAVLCCLPLATAQEIIKVLPLGEGGVKVVDLSAMFGCGTLRLTRSVMVGACGQGAVEGGGLRAN